MSDPRHGLRVIVSGARKGVAPSLIEGVLGLVVRLCGGIRTIVHGDADGVDSQAASWARRNGVRLEPHPADWNRYGPRAGPMRNSEMAAAGANLCVCFPGPNSVGTWDMAEKARKAGIPVWTIEAPKPFARDGT